VPHFVVTGCHGRYNHMVSSAFGHHLGLWVITNIADDVMLPSPVIPPKESC